MSKLISHVSYRVPYADSDQMGVVYYANYLVYFERLRNELLRDVGLPYAELEERGFGLPVLEAHVNYKQAARYDDVLDIRGWVSWVKAIRLQVNCEVRKNDKVIAEGHTVHAFVSRDTLRPIRIPDDIVSCFNRTERSEV